jgi:hypothetical protein
MVSTAEIAAAASATFFAAREEGGRELEEGGLEREEGGLTPEAEVVELGAGMDGKRGRSVWDCRERLGRVWTYLSWVA